MPIKKHLPFEDYFIWQTCFSRLEAKPDNWRYILPWNRYRTVLESVQNRKKCVTECYMCMLFCSATGNTLLCDIIFGPAKDLMFQNFQKIITTYIMMSVVSLILQSHDPSRNIHIYREIFLLFNSFCDSYAICRTVMKRVKDEKNVICNQEIFSKNSKILNSETYGATCAVIHVAYLQLHYSMLSVG